MVMKASLQLKMGQSLTMTPQLQQAIRLLQLSTLDLQQEIQQALESNPMLESTEDDQDDSPQEQNSDQADTQERANADEPTSSDDNWDESEWSADNNSAETIPDDLPV